MYSIFRPNDLRNWVFRRQQSTEKSGMTHSIGMQKPLLTRKFRVRCWYGLDLVDCGSSCLESFQKKNWKKKCLDNAY